MPEENNIDTNGPEEVIAVIEASATRRVLAVAMLLCLGGLLIYVALTTPADLVWRAFLLFVGGISLWLAERMNAATKQRLELTDTELRDSSGVQLVRIDEIASVSRGMMALKPSNGFTLVLHQKKGPARWRPGLWWRLGSRVGIGGVTSGSQTKPTAQIIEAMLLERATPDA